MPMNGNGIWRGHFSCTPNEGISKSLQDVMGLTKLISLTSYGSDLLGLELSWSAIWIA